MLVLYLHVSACGGRLCWCYICMCLRVVDGCVGVIRACVCVWWTVVLCYVKHLPLPWVEERHSLAVDGWLVEACMGVDKVDQ